MSYTRGGRYKSKKIPIDAIKKEYESRKSEAVQIDQRICAYAMAHADDTKYIIEAYRRLFYAQKYLDSFDTSISKRQRSTVKLLNGSTFGPNNYQFAKVQNALEELNQQLMSHGIEKIEKELFEAYASKEAIDCINKYLSQRQNMFTGDSISSDSIKLLFDVCYGIRETHSTILSSAKTNIVNACLSRQAGIKNS